MLISDKDIPTANPADIVSQYSGWVKKIVKKYSGLMNESGAADAEDMYQAGTVGLLEAIQSYNPASGKSFISWSFCPIRNAILALFGLDNPGRKRPQMPVAYLDEPINAEETAILADVIEDPNSKNPEEKAVEDAEREEICIEVRAAVDRLKDEKQKHILKRVWFEGQDKKSLAAELHLPVDTVRRSEKDARCKLMHDYRLKTLDYPRYIVGLTRYKITMTSAVEAAVLWREKQIDNQFGIGSFVSIGRQENGGIKA